ncbi:hypothetical protein Ptr902_11781 [Pyrenophora tritici-repentis]|nr:hypothetical protein Ptr902_11781 [Pyrenophora tritici-repentis]
MGLVASISTPEDDWGMRAWRRHVKRPSDLIDGTGADRLGGISSSGTPTDKATGRITLNKDWSRLGRVHD